MLWWKRRSIPAGEAKVVRHLKVKEFADRLGYHPDTILMRIRRGEIKAYRIGKRGHYRIAETELPKNLRVGEYETVTQRKKRAMKALASIQWNHPTAGRES